MSENTPCQGKEHLNSSFYSSDTLSVSPPKPTNHTKVGDFGRSVLNLTDYEWVRGDDEVFDFNLRDRSTDIPPS